MENVNRVIDRIINVMIVLAGILIIFLMLSISFGVLARLTGKPPTWVIELNEYALLYITFLAGAWVLRHDSHVKVDIILMVTPPRVRAGMNIVNSIIGLLVSLILTIYGLQVTLDLFERGVYNPTLLAFPKWVLIAVIPLGFFFIGVQFLRRIIMAWGEITGRVQAQNEMTQAAVAPNKERGEVA